MKCPKCNQEIADNSKFCEHCGAPVSAPQPQAVPSQSQAVPPQSQAVSPQPQAVPPQMMQQPSAKKPVNKKQVGLIAGIAAAALVVIVLLVVIVKTHKTKIDLQDYAEVEFSGYDKYGTAELNFDSEKMWEKFYDAAGIKTDTGDDVDWDSLSDDIKNYADLIKLEGKMEWKLNKQSGLKNGDTVQVSFTFDNDLAKEFHVKFVGETMKVKVSGLDAVKEINPFDDVAVEFSGVSPNAYVQVTNNSTEEGVSSLYFSAEPSNYLKIGDKITVSVDYDEESFVQEYGCVLTQTEKEYEVDKVDAYLSASEDITDDFLAQMKSQTEDAIRSYFAGEKEYISQKNLKYVGYYFLTNKKEYTYSVESQNIIYIVYSATVKSKNKEFKASKVYFPVRFTNAMKYADGTLYVDLNSTDIEGSTNLSYDWWKSVSGYIKESDMKNELVTASLGEFTSESAGGLK